MTTPADSGAPASAVLRAMVVPHFGGPIMFSHRIQLSFGTRFAAGLAVVLCTASGVAARPAVPVPVAPKNTDVRVLETALGELPFGAGVERLTKWIGKRLDRTWGPRIVKAVDDHERAELRAAQDKELADVTGNEVVFDGRRTGWESSIIADEFAAGTSESAYVWRDGELAHFFFMHEGKLWKYARRLEDGAGPFAARLADYEAKLGAPVTVDKESDGEGGHRPVCATWRGASYDIKAFSRRMLYGGDLFIIQDRAAAATIATLRAKQGAKIETLGPPTGAIDAFLLGPEDAKE